MKTIIILTTLLCIELTLKSQSLNGTWETCPNSTNSVTYEAKQMPTNCKYDWEVSNGTIYDGTTKIGTKLSSTTKLSIDVKWDQETDYDYKTTTSGQYPTGLIKITAVGCTLNDGSTDSQSNGINTQGTVVIKSIKNYKIPNVLVNNSFQTPNNQLDYTNYNGAVEVKFGSLPINYPPNGLGYVKTEYPTEFSWSLPQGWKDASNRSGSFNASSALTLTPPCWGYSPAGTTNNLQISIIHPDISCIVGQELQKGAPFVLKIQKDAPYVTGFSSSTNSFPWGEEVSFSCTASTNRTDNIQYVWNLPNGFKRTSTGSSGSIVTTTPNLDITSTGCNTTEPISVKVQKESCGQSLSINKYFTFSYPTLSGPTIVCSSGSLFLANNLPSNATVSWICPQLNFPNGNTGNSVLVTPVSIGNSTVLKAQISNTICQIEKSIDIRFDLPSNFTATVPIYHYGAIKCQSAEANSILGAGGHSEWMVDKATFYTQNCNKLANIDEPYISDRAWFKSSKKITTPITLAYRAYVDVCGGMYSEWKYYEIPYQPTSSIASIYLSPIPANTDLTVNVDRTINEESISNLKSTSILPNPIESAINIYSLLGIKIISLQTTSNPITIPVSNLKDGVYIIEIIDGNNSSRKQFIIKH